MPDGQSGVLESLADGVNVERMLRVAPIPSTPQYERPSYVFENDKWGNGRRGTLGGTSAGAVVTTGQIYPSDAEYTSSGVAISSVFMPTIRQAFFSRPWPDDLFWLSTEQRSPFMAATSLDQLFQRQPGNTYNLLPF